MNVQEKRNFHIYQANGQKIIMHRISRDRTNSSEMLKQNGIATLFSQEAGANVCNAWAPGFAEYMVGIYS